MSADPPDADLEGRSYPRTWLLLDALEEGTRVLGHEVVDLSPGAFELRDVARELRRRGDARERWLTVDEGTNVERVVSEQRHQLSFGPEVRYWVERDVSRTIHRGAPFRHLFVEFSRRIVTPATSAEIGLYFYGRRPAIFAFTRRDRVHGFIGMEWEPLSRGDVRALLRRELGGGADGEGRAEGS